MSQQQQYEHFSFNENYFNGPASGNSDHLLSPWQHHNTKPPVPRPASATNFAQNRPSISTPQRGTPIRFSQPNSAQDKLPVDPYLHPLRGQGRASFSYGAQLSSSNPLIRFYEESNDSWTPERASFKGSGAPFRMPSISQTAGNLDVTHYPQHPGSELSSNGPSDSGYHSHPATQSIVSLEPEHPNQELPEVSFRVRDFSIAAPSVEQPAMPPDAPNTEPFDQAQAQNRIIAQPMLPRCSHCGEQAKCPSDLKKHILKHEKPYKCDIKGCRRGDKGFTTPNDLNRHKKSVHRVGVLHKSYQCASEHCRNKEKIWPRLDNFKQHVHRMHPDEDENELIRRSTYQARRPIADQTVSVAPMDTTLAGIGKNVDQDLPNVDVSGNISLSPDQPMRWDQSFQVSSPDESMADEKVTQSSEDGYTSSPGKANLERHPGYGSAKAQSARIDPPMNHIGSLPNGPNASGGLSTLADVACGTISDPTSSRYKPAVSRKPQTKAEQQKQVLPALLKALAEEMERRPSQLPSEREAAALPSLSTTVPSSGNGDRGSAPVHGSKSPKPRNARIAFDLLGNLDADLRNQLLHEVKNLLKQRKQYPIRHNLKFSCGWVLDDGTSCFKAFARPSELRKHQKRHTKPFGCVFPNCRRSFGSKSDWIRHEGKRHDQVQVFRCQQAGRDNSPCSENFYDQQKFKAHLETTHNLTEPVLSEQIKESKLGANFQVAFWCGFCNARIKAKNKRNAAMKERFDHIADHFIKEKRQVSEWFCFETNKYKGELTKALDKFAFEDEDIDIDDPNFVLTMQRSPSQSDSEGSSASSDDHDGSTVQSTSRKRGIEDADGKGSSQAKKTKQRHPNMTWFCCQCDFGPQLSQVSVSCIQCSHQGCSACSSKPITDEQEDAGV